MRILIVEDERDLNELIKRKLTSEGYGVDACYTGVQAMEYVEDVTYDGIILDIMIPEMNGFEVLTRIRRKGIQTPVMFLTARISVEDRVRGLDLGASDYLVKPFSFQELLARLRAMTRRSFGVSTNLLQVGDLQMDTSTGMVKRGERTIDLASKEYALLQYMMLNKGVVLSRDMIEDHIWNYEYEGGTNVVDVYIRYLRRKIDEGEDQKLIHTVRGRGYVLREDL